MYEHADWLLPLIVLVSGATTSAAWFVMRRRFARAISLPSAIVLATYVWMLCFGVCMAVTGGPFSDLAADPRWTDKAFGLVKLASWLWYYFVTPLVVLVGGIEVGQRAFCREWPLVRARASVLAACIVGWLPLILLLGLFATGWLPMV